MERLARVLQQLLEQQQQQQLQPQPLEVELAAALHALLQDGLTGNRAVAAGSVWPSLATAATRAFPIQLSPSADKAQAVAAAGHNWWPLDVGHTWVLQAATDGSLALLVEKIQLPSQPQIHTAYARNALLRQQPAVQQLLAALQQLKGVLQLSPFDRHLQATAAAAAAPAAAPPQPIHIQTEQDVQVQAQQLPNGGGGGSSSSSGTTADTHASSAPVSDRGNDNGAAAHAKSPGPAHMLRGGSESVKSLLQGLHQSAASGLQHSAAAGAAAAGGAVAAVMTWRAGGGSSSTVAPGGSQCVRVQLLVQPPPQPSEQQPGAVGHPGEQGVKVLLSVVDAGSSTAAAPPSAAAEGRDGWPSRVLLDRLRLTRGTSSRKASQHSEPQHAGNSSKPQQQQQQQEEAVPPDQVLEGDMWSVMGRLRGATGSMSARTALANAAAAADAECLASAVEQRLQESGQALAQALSDCCRQVAAAAAATKGCLGEEAPQLMQLVALVSALLNHGLLNCGGSSSNSQQRGGGGSSAATPEPAAAPAGGSSRGTAAALAAASAAASGVTATARGMLGGLLQGRQQTAFGVLQALQHGANHHPRVALGADEIARMQAAKAAPSATKLELWLRASLNEQLLGVRLSMLAGSGHALAHFYHPAALLLQHHALAAVMQAVSALSEHRFALPVELQAPAAAAGGSGSEIGQQQHQHGVGGVPTSRGAAVAAALDPRKLLSGLASAGLGPLRGGSATAMPAAAAAATAGVPTFLWGGSSSSNSSQAAAATATPAGPGPESTAASSGGGFFRRRGQQQRMAPLATKPAGAGLAREPSAQLSPVSIADEAACSLYAEWWQDSEQDPAGVVAADGQGSNAGSGSMSSSLRSQALGTGASGELAAVSPSAAGGGRRWSGEERGGGSASSGPSGATSAAALKIEADLTAAMLSPTASRRSVDGGGGPSLCSSSSGGGGSGGWDAAVARARSVEAAPSGAGGRRPCHLLQEQQPES